MRVSARAPAKKRSPYLGMIYDAIARRVGHFLFYVRLRTCACFCASQEWSERSAANEDGFSVDDVSTVLHEELLLSAEAEYDAADAAKSKKVPSLFSPLCAIFIALYVQVDNHAYGHKTQSKSYSMFLCCVFLILRKSGLLISRECVSRCGSQSRRPSPPQLA